MKKSRPFAFFLTFSGAIHLAAGFVFIFSDLQKLFRAERTVVSAVKVNLSAMTALPPSGDQDKLPLKKAEKRKTSLKTPPKKKIPKKKIKKKKPKKKPARKNPKPAKDKPPEPKPPPPPQEPPIEESPPPDLSNQKPESGETERDGDTQETQDSEEAARMEAENIERLRGYAANIVMRIRLNWNLPKSLAEKDLFAQVEIQVSESGEFLSRRLVASSQNELFDKLALQAVERAAPFPPPPPEIRKLIKDGIVFGLPSRD